MDVPELNRESKKLPTESVFPEQFRHLEKFSAWALPSEQQRLRKKCSMPMQEIQEAYAALVQSLDAIVEYLNQFPFDALPADARRLMDFACCIVTCDTSVSGWGKPDLPDVFPVNRWEIVDERW